MKQALNILARGAAFEYAGQRWIVLEHNENGGTLCLTENIITKNRAFDNNNCNDWSKSSSKAYLNGAFLDNLIDTAGSGTAFLKSEVDLTTYDGLKDYGTCKATIFLLTEDQYRRNRDVIPDVDDWWWLSTALCASANGKNSFARIIDPTGRSYWIEAYPGIVGLRPACYLSSDVLVCEETETNKSFGQRISNPEHDNFIRSFLIDRHQFETDN